MRTGLDRVLKPPAELSQSRGPHKVTIKRIVLDGSYMFTLPSWDAGRQLFGPADGPLGLVVGDYAFAWQTVEGEWFLYKPN